MEYHRVARALRATARVVLQRRMKDIQDGADVPRDLMSNVMKTECKSIYVNIVQYAKKKPPVSAELSREAYTFCN